MEYEIITFKHFKIFKKKITNIDLDKVSQEFFNEIDFFSKFTSSDTVMKPNIRRLNEICYNELKSIYEKELGTNIKSGYQKSWFFYSAPKSTDLGNYHTHQQLSDRYPEIFTDYVWTFYLKTPNNCVGNEGKLAFKHGDDEFFVDAEVGYLYSFKYDLLHKGVEAPNSDLERLVAVGNIAFKFEQN